MCSQRFPEARAKWAKAFRYVLVDEYQDTNHAQYVLLQLLAEEHQNLMAVGDPDQCLVAGTQVRMADGTERPIEELRVGDEVLSCYGSGVFRPARVTARPPLRPDGRESRSRRRGGRRIVSTPEHTHFAGFKPGWTPQLHMTYLMWKHGSGFRIGTSRTYTNGQRRVAGWAVDSTERRARRRYLGRRSSRRPRPRHAWRRRCCLCGIDCRRCRSSLGPRRGAAIGRSVVADQALLDRLFREIDTGDGGKSLLDDHGLSFAHPHFSSATTTTGARVRRRLTVALCGDPRGGKPQHRISLFGYDDEGRHALEGDRAFASSRVQGSSGWRFETCHSDLSKIAEIIERIQGVLDVSVRYTARLGRSDGAAGKERNSLPFMLASAVRPGMVMVTETGDFDVVESVERVELDDPVYDLDIERTHNFVANGLVTHNSIYAFRGADIRNILEFERTSRTRR